MVGPNYKRPSAPPTPAFKEPLPAGWKEAQPSDGAIRGKWWEIYNEPQLNALEERVDISNQNVLAAEAQYRAARSAVRIARAGLFPTVAVSPAISTTRSAVSQFPSQGASYTTYSLPAAAAWPVDIWGAVRRSVKAASETAQADFALLENARLSYQAELAQDYFELHDTDGDIDLLQTTVKSYVDYLKLTQDRFKSGVASGADVAQAETQLETTRAQLIDLEAARTQYEHAIAVLTGQPPALVTVPAEVLKTPPPQVPVAVPSTLLERRPDIAASERQMAAAYEQIGIAIAAYYPSLNLGASAGFGPDVASLFWPSRFFTLSGALSETVYEGGKRRAQVAENRALFDTTVANYRQTVLTAFQQVEDNLAALRVYEHETDAVNRAVKAADEALKISTYQYKAGTVAYLQIITSQAALLAEQRVAVDLLAKRMIASVLLVEALGGGWNSTNMPTASEVLHGK